MMNKKVQKAFNNQINAELYSAYLYWSMAAYFESINLSGFANWMVCQAQEETSHAARFYRHVNERGGRVVMAAIDAPPTEWDSPVAVFENVYEHEQKVTSLIHGLVDISTEEKDHAAANFLQWFVAEQVEEEADADSLLQQLKMMGDAKHGLMMMDRELAGRTFTPAASESEPGE